jgi:uncharacterized protein
MDPGYWEPEPVIKISLCIAAILTVIAAATAHAAPPGRVYFPRPYVAAAKVIRLADLGDMNAEAQLGWMYSTGQGVPRDFYEAAKWLYRAATQGQGWAQFQLGLLYNRGEGVPRDYVMAYTWFNLSASQATGNDHDYRARLRDALAAKMTPAQVSAAQELALTWYKSR